MRVHIPNYPDATLIISGWSSRCNACRKGANPYDKTHTTVLGYGVSEGEVGCGVRWTHVASDMALPKGENMVAAMRPDLKFVSAFSEEK